MNFKKYSDLFNKLFMENNHHLLLKATIEIEKYMKQLFLT